MAGGRWLLPIGALLLHGTARAADPQGQASAVMDAVPSAGNDDLFAQVWINGVDSELIVQFHHGDDHGKDCLSASGDDLRALGLAQAAGSASVPLCTIPGLTYHVDPALQTVAITVDAAALQAVDLAPEPTIHRLSDAAWGGVMSYAAYAERSDGKAGGGATLDARLFGPMGTLGQTMLVRDRRGGAGLSVRRLETRYVLDDPERMRRLLIGDHLATDGTATGAVRAAGIQFSTRFALQPDLITAPMPRLAGGSGVPSTVDLFVDGVKRSSQTAGAGTYTVSRTPIVNGAGKVSMVVRDILGRETVQTLSFYGTTDLLRPGLHAFSGQAGLLRKDAFGAQDRYRDAFLSGVYRLGLSDWATVETRGVLSRRIAQTGMTVSAKLGEMALLSIGADVAAHDADQGVQAVVAIRRDAGRLSFYANVQKAFGGFRTIAAAAGDPVTRFQAQLGGSFQTATLGSFALSATRFRTHRYDNRIFAGNWSRQISPRLMLFGNVVHSRDVRSEMIATLGITVALSRRSTAAVQGIHDRRGGWSGSASWSDAPPIEGCMGYRGALSAGQRAETRAIGGATWRGARGEVGFDATVADRGVGMRAFASGSAVWLGGGPRLVAHVGESFALVETGHPGVGVSVENRFAGTTGQDGRLLVPNLPPQAPTRIAVDLDGLGIAYDAAVAETVVRPRDGTGTVVALAVRPVRAAVIRLIDEAGDALPLGARVRRGDGREDIVAYDGIVDLRDVAEQVEAEVRTPSGLCRIAFRSNTTDPVTCHAR